MRKILLTGAAAALALSLSACNIDVNGKATASEPSGSASAPTSAPAPSGAPSHHRGTGGTGSGPGGSEPTRSGRPCDPNVSPIRQGACPVKVKSGPLRYLASGKYTVGDTAFFTTQNTVLVVASGTCPDGTSSGPNMRCGIDGMDKWVQASPHNVVVHFDGGTATKIQETQ
ncbi:hypothetical protein DZF91_02385 [Actinomadura logoneensis]|uniref:Lipoprotein n=1 Tax=Actinomadura logoneensis TaxID=2293572 RepID=A0A372JTE9_9ACTN|nr:hypothetical protein [Actinomadura logoneensis]RFU43230.1 hypothetical protein DZF91_02385 [Actinomadura logoneensis]